MTRPTIPGHDGDLLKSFDSDLKRSAGLHESFVVRPFYATGFAFVFWP
jgi:hypothetical protein